MKTESLQHILQRPWVWRGRGQPVERPVLPTGHPELDLQLPEGWPLGAVSEILVRRAGSGELCLLVPALQHLAESGGLIAWIAPPYLPYAPALQQRGLDRASVVIRATTTDDALWAAEQTLRSGACSAVLCWPGRMDDRRFRRLQLAAEAGACWGVVFRSARHLRSQSPAALRLAIRARQEGQELTILKRRGGRAPQAAVVLPHTESGS